MSDIYNRRPKKKGLDPVLGFMLVLGALVAIAVGALVYLLNSDPDFRQNYETRAREGRFESEFVRDDGFGPIIEVLKTEFPDDYEALKRKMFEGYDAGASTGQRTDILFDFLEQFTTKHAAQIAVAPSSDLKAVREAQLKTLQVMKSESVADCASAFMADSGQTLKYSTAGAVAMNQETAALLRAIAAGRDTPVKPRGPLTPADGDAYQTATEEAGITPQLREIYRDKGRLSAASDETKCTIGTAFFTGLNNMPDDSADRLTISMFVADEESK